MKAVPLTSPLFEIIDKQIYVPLKERKAVTTHADFSLRWLRAKARSHFDSYRSRRADPSLSSCFVLLTILKENRHNDLAEVLEQAMVSVVHARGISRGEGDRRRKESQ